MARRLPGITVRTVSPTPAQVLPRMDIGAFVGLAASGPLDLPVPVEGVGEYREIFGGELPLAFDRVRQVTTSSHLPGSVEAYFRNGGRRCWVTRVARRVDPYTSARDAAARAHRYPLVGLLRGEDLRPGLAFARSEGAWADDLRVLPLKRSRWLAAVGFDADAGSVDVIATSSEIEVGAVLQLTFGEQGPVACLTAQAVTSLVSGCRVSGALRWFRRLPASTYDLSDVEVVQKVGALESEELTLVDLTLPGATRASCALTVEGELGEVDEGDLLTLRFADGATMLTLVSAVDSGSSTTEETLEITGELCFWPVDDADEAGFTDGAVPSVEKVEVDLRVWRGEENLAAFTRLGLSASHARFFGALPDDRTLYALDIDGRPTRWGSGTLQALAARPRFPLAGAPGELQLFDDQSPDPAEAYLPLFLPLLPDLALARGPLDDTDADSRLAREGLASFTADLFLDPELVGYGVDTLAQAAWERFHGEEGRSRPVGVYALWPVEEITFVAAPDASHLGWEQEAAESTVLAAPDLDALPRLPEGERATLSWSEVDGVDSYRLQGATLTDFSDAQTWYEGDETSARIDAPTGCSHEYFVRVRGQIGAEAGPWSVTRWARWPTEDFGPCETGVVEAPTLELPEEDEDDAATLILSWSGPTGASFEAQYSSDAAFTLPVDIRVSPTTDTSARTLRPSGGVRWYRVRAWVDDVASAWSNTRAYNAAGSVLFVTPSPEDWATTDAAGDALAVHRALLRLCAARLDTLALLSVPVHFGVPEVRAHLASLSPLDDGESDEVTGSGELQVTPLSAGEARALSYGGLYHPWVHLTRSGSQVARLLPPDGVVAGSWAATALDGGAWTAPAGRALTGVVSLEPSLSVGEWSQLYEVQSNTLRQDVSGFMAMGADTLSAEEELRSLPVRRLLVLLRRLALREGMSWVFEPNTNVFRRRVQARLEGFMSQLYARRAFSGRTAAESYRVTVDTSAEARAEQEQGRLVVELRVAPARPMAFMTLRLVQTSGQGLSVEEG